jgi:hypothetical protein
VSATSAPDTTARAGVRAWIGLAIAHRLHCDGWAVHAAPGQDAPRSAGGSGMRYRPSATITPSNTAAASACHARHELAVALRVVGEHQPPRLPHGRSQPPARR